MMVINLPAIKLLQGDWALSAAESEHLRQGKLGSRCKHKHTVKTLFLKVKQITSIPHHVHHLQFLMQICSCSHQSICFSHVPAQKYQISAWLGCHGYKVFINRRQRVSRWYVLAKVVPEEDQLKADYVEKHCRASCISGAASSQVSADFVFQSPKYFNKM